MPPSSPQRRALLSVSDKHGIVEFAAGLTKLGWQIVSTGGTKSLLAGSGIAVTGVEEITGFPECFSGRVKTMHPLLMGGILFRRTDPDHQQEAERLGVAPIDLVCVNLYPFAETMKDPSKTRADIVEQIDIGGPTLLRSAAKNHEHVTVLCDPADYAHTLAELKDQGDTSLEFRQSLAAKVFLHTAAYDARIAEYLSDGSTTGIMLARGSKLRYGENPHQWGKYYEIYDGGSAESSGEIENGKLRIENNDNASELGSTSKILNSQFSILHSSNWGKLYQGKELSYLNILDADAAWNAVQEFEDPTAVFVKHANPSGIASHASIEEAFQRAYDADRLSAFGVIIALNRPCTEKVARKIIDQQIFTEVIVAPSYDAAALKALQEKPNIRVIEQKNGDRLHEQILYRSVLGGMLAQDRDNRVVTEADLTLVTSRKPSPDQVRDLLFAWKAVKHAKSNAIVLVKDGVTVGIGAGQTSRVDSTWIAVKRAGERAKGSVMASDAFFPFPDSVEEAAKKGISAVIQPGGSVKDQEVFQKAEELGLVMMTTGVRAFRH